MDLHLTPFPLASSSYYSSFTRSMNPLSRFPRLIILSSSIFIPPVHMTIPSQHCLFNIDTLHEATDTKTRKLITTHREFHQKFSTLTLCQDKGRRPRSSEHPE
ncbi:hypothetical protein ILYODFUR_002552 [Ilyodon furcidens]|uniref:Uncharacterized protein n=1 Tax=Ilyodon furcidens TaxID=33524 RepID=A0ABV0US15_9TELE